MPFKINSVFNSATLSLANDSHKVIYVKRENIFENPHNKEIYSTENIELMSYGIEDKGLLEPIIVSVLRKGDTPENTLYQIVSGHRRMLAISRIVERNAPNASDFAYIPCIVRSKQNTEADELSEYEDLIDGNLFNRNKSDAERAKELQIKKRILEKRKQNRERIPGKILMLLASEMNISPHQAKKLDSINRKASDSVKKAFEDGELSTDAAFELSRTDTETQDEALKQLETEPSKTAKAVRSVIEKQHEEKSDQPEKSVSKDTKNYLESLGGDVLLLKADITSHASCKKIVESVINKYGKIDVLVNNSGVQYQQDSLDKISDEQFDYTMKVNIYGMFYLTKEVLPYLKSGASIINLSSVTTFFGEPQLIDYVTTKGAIVGFTRSLARNLALKNIRVNAIAPGFFWTPLQPACWVKEKIPSLGSDAAMARGAMPCELAPTFVFLASTDSSYMTGQVIHVNGGQVMG